MPPLASVWMRHTKRATHLRVDMSERLIRAWFEEPGRLERILKEHGEESK
jgi:hypothetical protein